MPKLNVSTAKASDFDAAAQRWANGFWFWAVAVAAVYWLAGMWWALIPLAMAVLSIAQSISCTMAATKMREGRWRFPNPNNGYDT